jgi:hypothetical protein
MKNKWILVIDTDSYAGNFERDLCAYTTGIIGDCEVGEDFAALYNKEVNIDGLESIFMDILERRPDENGCHRPCSLWETKGWLSDGTEDGAVREEDWNQARADKNCQKTSAAYYQDSYDVRAKMDLKDPSVIRAGWTRAGLDKELKRIQKDIDRVKKEKYPRNPPMNSVAIFFEKKPTDEMITLIKERAAKFAEAKRNKGDAWDKNFKLIIHGFRLIKETTIQQEENI